MKKTLLNLKNIKTNRVSADNLSLNDLINQGFLKSVKNKLSDLGEIQVAAIQIFVIPKTGNKKEKKGSLEHIILEHSSASDFKTKKVQISVSNPSTLKKILN